MKKNDNKGKEAKTVFIEERHKKILEVINEKKRILVSEIEKMYNVSSASARRDLRILEKQGLVQRTHGGAILPNDSYKIESQPVAYNPKKMEHVYENYLRVACTACRYINEGDSVFITSGSVGYLMAQNVPTDINFIAITNSIIVAEELCQHQNITVIMCGGILSQKGTTHDSYAIETVEKFTIDKAFLTSATISLDFGAALQNPTAIGIMNSVIKMSKLVIGLYPKEKIEKKAVFSVCRIDKFDILITDNMAPLEFLKECEKKEIEVILAK